MEEILNDDCNVNQDIINKIAEVMPDESVLYDVSELL